MGFVNISKQIVPAGRTVELVLNQLAGDPVVVVEHLGETNTLFWSDAIAKANTQAATRGRQQLTPAQIKEARVKNREVLVRYAVRDLKGFVHDDGRTATMDDLAEIVAALPDDVVDSIMIFCANAENFRARAIASDATATAGKS